jgi:hypothetical protein
LNQDRDWWMLKGKFSVRLDGLAGITKQHNYINDLDGDWKIGM